MTPLLSVYREGDPTDARAGAGPSTGSHPAPAQADAAPLVRSGRATWVLGSAPHIQSVCRRRGEIPAAPGA